MKEIFNPPYPKGFVAFAEEQGEDTARLKTDADAFLSVYDAFMTARRPANRFVVFVAMYNHIESLIGFDLGRLFERLHVIHLVRRNVLRTHVSDLINNLRNNGERIKPPHTHDSNAGDMLVQIEVPAETLIANLRKRASHITEYRQRLEPIEHIEMAYEDLLADPHRANDALTALGFDRTPLSTNLRPSNPYSLKKIIINFDTIEAALRDTEFALLLNA